MRLLRLPNGRLYARRFGEFYLYTECNLPLSDLFHVISSSLLARTLKLYHTAALSKRHLPSNFIRQLAQLFADALDLFLVTMHDGILKQGVKSLDRLYRTCPP